MGEEIIGGKNFFGPKCVLLHLRRQHPFLEGNIRTARSALCTARAFLPTLSCIFHIFSGWQGRGGLRGKHTTTEASTPSSSPMVVVAAHTPCQGRAVGRGRRGCRTLRYGRSTEEPSDKNQMKKTLSGLHNGKNKRRNQMENKPFRSAQGEEQGD